MRGTPVHQDPAVAGMGSYGKVWVSRKGEVNAAVAGVEAPGRAWTANSQPARMNRAIRSRRDERSRGDVDQRDAAVLLSKRDARSADPARLNGAVIATGVDAAAQIPQHDPSIE